MHCCLHLHDLCRVWSTLGSTFASLLTFMSVRLYQDLLPPSETSTSSSSSSSSASSSGGPSATSTTTEASLTTTWWPEPTTCAAVMHKKHSEKNTLVTYILFIFCPPNSLTKFELWMCSTIVTVFFPNKKEHSFVIKKMELQIFFQLMKCPTIFLDDLVPFKTQWMCGTKN